MKPEAQGGSGAVWGTVALTALAAPVGSVVVALLLRQLVTVSSSGGMEDLAAVVVGLWLGAPLAALLVFAVCLFTLLKDTPMRRGLALGVMAVVCVLVALVTMAGLRFSLIVVLVLCLAGFGAGAYFAIRLARM